MSELTLENRKENKRNWRLALIIVALVAVAAIAALALSGVFGGTSATTNGPEVADSPLALWESQDINSYQYTIQVTCFCPPDLREPVLIEVIDGEVASMTTVADGSAVVNTEFFERYNTIDKLFTIISETDAQEPASSDITYDETYGVPLSASIDISEMMADEEIYWTVTDFAPIQ